MKKTHKELSGFNLKKKKSPFLSWPGIISMVRCGIIIILSLYSVVESSRKTDQIRHEMWGGAEAFKPSLVITKSENGTTLFFLPLQITSKGSCCHPFTSTVSKLLSLWTQEAGFRLAIPKQWCTSSNFLFIYLNASAPETQACPTF